MILDERGKSMKKNDWILAGVIVVSAVAILLFQFTRGDSGAGEVTVTVDGELFGTYSLAEDQSVDIGGTNRLIIRDGTAQMEWADCPDQVCVDHSAISREGESMICLPNQVVVSVESGEEAEMDGMGR